MSESKSLHIRLVKLNWRKRLIRQNQKVSGLDRVVRLLTTILNNSRRATDGTHPSVFESSLINRVSPMHPTSVVSEP
ncbi:MAG: hypothetical protein PWQ52_900 [Methanolobus sp.]|nr:hypothetical protein [Methanolobus sp.]